MSFLVAYADIEVAVIRPLLRIDRFVIRKPYLKDEVVLCDEHIF